MDSQLLHTLLDFDIDRYLNPYIPQCRLHIVPSPLRHFLGYRNAPQTDPPAVLRWICSLIATVTGLCLVGAVFNYGPGVAEYHTPALIASFGASAVLDYNAMRSPLAQPRNAVLGHTLSAITGVGIAKLFQLSPEFSNIQWVSGAVGAGCASFVMSMTNTVHPPGGATAVLASTEPAIIRLGWTFIPLVLLASLLMLVVALLLNNILRQYPLYWWTSEETGAHLGQAMRRKQDEQGMLEKQIAASVTDRQAPTCTITRGCLLTSVTSERTLRREMSYNLNFVEDIDEVRIIASSVHMPSYIDLGDDEVMLLQRLQERLQKHSKVSR